MLPLEPTLRVSSSLPPLGEEKNMKHRFKLAIVFATTALLGGCAIPLPFYAPSTELLAEQDDLPLVSSALGDSKVQASRTTLALRSGRVLSISQNPGRQDYLRDLPLPLHGPDKARTYVPPPAEFHHLQAGDRINYGFSITPQFAEAMQFFYLGDAKSALRVLDGILASDGQPPHCFGRHHTFALIR